MQQQRRSSIDDRYLSAGGADAAAGAAEAPATPSTGSMPGSTGSMPVSIPVRYSRLRLRAQGASASSISPSPSTHFMAGSSAGQADSGILSAAAAAAGPRPFGGASSVPTNAASAAAAEASIVPRKRPPLPPSPPAPRTAHQPPPQAAAWIAPVGSGSGGRQPRLLAAAAAAGGSGSASPGGHGGLLSASLSAEDVSAAAGNPFHPQYDQAMQLLLQHQTQQMQALRQQQQWDAYPASSSSSMQETGRSAAYVGLSAQQAGSFNGGSPLLSRNASFNRLSELGTSPGLIEASFMGMAARASSSRANNNNNGSPSSATLQQLLAAQQSAERQQEQQQRQFLRHCRSAASLAEWGRDAPAGSDAALLSLRGTATPAWQQQQQQQQQQLVSASLPRSGTPVGGTHTPQRRQQHWLRWADDSESAARGLLGLPLPPKPGGTVHRQLHYQQQLQQQQQQQVEDVEQGGVLLQHSGSAADLQQQALEQQQQAAWQEDQAAAVAAAAVVGSWYGGSPLAANASRGFFSARSFGRQRSTSNLDAAGLLPTCLICLDQLTQADFEAGDAMYLECSCKGEVALRHRQCAEKWSRIKGNTICDVCKAPILNLPEVPPLPPPPEASQLFADGAGGGRLLLDAGGGLWGPLGEEPATAADRLFDCIRVTWVVLIICILFFKLPVSTAFVVGSIAGCSYVAVASSWASLAQWRRAQQEQQQAAAAEGFGAWHDGHRVPLLLGPAERW